MSDTTLQPQPAFHGHLTLAGTMSAKPGAAGVTVQPRDDLALAIVMARNGQSSVVMSKVRELYGIDLPSGPKRVVAGSLAFIGMGPGQWLAIEQGGQPLTFAARLTEGLAGAASISDQSDSRAVLRLSGPRARDVLAKGLMIDLHPTVFGPDDAALSSVALIGAHVWQLDDTPTYEIAVFRSLAGSFADWLLSSAAEYGIALMST